MTEAALNFTCFGGACTVLVDGSGPAGGPQQAAETAKEKLIEWHARFSRFKPESELTRLNEDPRECVSVSLEMARFAQAVIDAAEATGGLVDATMLDEIEDAGYRDDRLRGTLALPLALAMAPPRLPAGPRPAARWREIEVDLDNREVTRPPGLKLDGGGVVKGLFADQLGEMLGGYRSYAVDCEGDLRIGGSEGVERPIAVTGPFGGELLHELVLSDGGVATTSISKRSWFGKEGKPAHHLLDPATGRPAYTGVVQVTAVAPTALEAEALTKAALLSG
ncbi:MAG: FAD:protein FMN transferase, partial [Actinomycetota bacterium]|nr:FAD:protein FMN transferase [Actinomycetota bacterium]